ncbi:hypothetical protein ACF3OH_12000 [Chryseomicrobium aureum]|uniref:hypothetical protein n=1 Tax=Chryseomicrobium aureum TaxID=1441723 RepID=UPI00370DABBA
MIKIFSIGLGISLIINIILLYYMTVFTITDNKYFRQKIASSDYKKLLVFLIISILFSSILISISLLSKKIEPDLMAALVSLLAVIVAIVAIYYQHKQFKINRKPYITPVRKSFAIDLPSILTDWFTGEKIDKRFSNLTIPIYNLGSTTAIDISYWYSLKNIEELSEYWNNKVYFDSTSYSIKVLDQDYPYSIGIKDRLASREANLTCKNFVNYADKIDPGLFLEVKTPTYFMIFISGIYKEQSPLLPNAPTPIFSLFIEYTDLDRVRHRVEFEMKSDVNNAHINKDKLNSSIVFKSIT